MIRVVDKARFYWNSLTISNSFQTFYLPHRQPEQISHAKFRQIPKMLSFYFISGFFLKNIVFCSCIGLLECVHCLVAVFMGYYCIGDLPSKAQGSLRDPHGEKVYSEANQTLTKPNQTKCYSNQNLPKPNQTVVCSSVPVNCSGIQWRAPQTLLKIYLLAI